MLFVCSFVLSGLGREVSRFDCLAEIFVSWKYMFYLWSERRVHQAGLISMAITSKMEELEVNMTIDTTWGAIALRRVVEFDSKETSMLIMQKNIVIYVCYWYTDGRRNSSPQSACDDSSS